MPKNSLNSIKITFQQLKIGNLLGKFMQIMCLRLYFYYLCSPVLKFGGEIDEKRAVSDIIFGFKPRRSPL